MVNMMTMISGGVAGQVARWVGAMIFVASLALIRRAGLPSFSTGVLPVVGQQRFDSAVQLRGQPCQNILEVGPRVMPAQLGTLQQAHHACGALAGQFAAYESTWRCRGAVAGCAGAHQRIVALTVCAQRAAGMLVLAKGFAAMAGVFSLAPLRHTSA